MYAAEVLIGKQLNISVPHAIAGYAGEGFT